MNESHIDKLYADGKALLDFLEKQKEYSFRSDVDNILKKNLLMAIASYFETEIKNILVDFIAKGTKNNTPIISFSKSKGIERQYHTYFTWDSTNANSFFGLFGEDFKNDALSDVNRSEGLKNSIKDFVEIGQRRNELAHQNYGSFYLDKTTDEVYQMYKNAAKFIEYLIAKFSKYL